ncbi:MAG: methyltransferase domain-containing protein [Peptostreptococcaceae bacterium]|nr:methyltransferase domain-containing protein [Peptostreptococcaceae bacterium]
MININALNEKITNRYEEESSMNCSLGCGNTLENLDVRKGETILDLGCGRGEETILMARMTGLDGKAIGLDLTKEMVSVAIDRATFENIANAVFVQGDIENLPFSENHFDGVASNCVINHAKDKDKVYREIYRVLKPGGRFVVADAVTKYPLPAEVKNDPEAWAQCYGGSVTEEEYMKAITNAGFSTIDILDKREYLKNGYDFASLTIRAVK